MCSTHCFLQQLLSSHWIWYKLGWTWLVGMFWICKFDSCDIMLDFLTFWPERAHPLERQISPEICRERVWTNQYNPTSLSEKWPQALSALGMSQWQVQKVAQENAEETLCRPVVHDWWTSCRLEMILLWPVLQIRKIGSKIKFCIVWFIILPSNIQLFGTVHPLLSWKNYYIFLMADMAD